MSEEFSFNTLEFYSPEAIVSRRYISKPNKIEWPPLKPYCTYQKIMLSHTGIVDSLVKEMRRKLDKRGGEENREWERRGRKRFQSPSENVQRLTGYRVLLVNWGLSDLANEVWWKQTRHLVAHVLGKTFGEQFKKRLWAKTCDHFIVQSRQKSVLFPPL